MDYSTGYMIQDIFGYLFYWYMNFNLVIRIALITIVLLFIAYTTLLISIFIKERYRSRRKTIRKRLTDSYVPYIKEAINDNNKRYTSQEISVNMNLHNRDFNVIEFRIFLEILFDLLKKYRDSPNFSRYNLRIVAEAIKLNAFLEKEIVYGSSKRRYVAITYAISFCVFIDIPDKSFKYLLASRVSEVRRAAKIGYMLFKDYDPFKYLRDDFDEDFCFWDKMQIHHVFDLRVREGRPIPNFEDFYRESQNPLMRIFFIEEIEAFNQTGSIPFLMEILQHLYRPRFVARNDYEIELTNAVINALGTMHYAAIEPILITNYNINSEKIRLAIINAMGKICSGKSLSFMKEIFKNESETIKVAIARAVYADKQNGGIVLQEMDDETDEFGKLTIAQIKSPYMVA
ncbi:MAG: HEAT repeat domain-containing protein [Bacteroidales bacterium]